MDLHVVFLLLLTVVKPSECVRRVLTEPEVARAVQLLEDGASMRTVAERFQVSPSVVHRLWTRYRETGLYRRRTGQGRKRKTTANQDRYIRQLAMRNRQSTARSLQNDFSRATHVRVSDQTVRNRLHEGGLHSRIPLRVPQLTPHHRTERLEFAREHQYWQLRHWRPVLFSDESRFHVSTCDRRVRVWRRQGERHAECNIVQHDPFGGGSTMVWGGVSLEGRTELIIIRRGTMTAQRYRDEVLAPVVVPYAGAVGESFMFMHDNARPHTARLTTAYLEQEGIEVMEWPARSPDLNPIEHVWDILYRRVTHMANPPQTIQELENALVQEWNAIPQGTIRRLIRSMPRRCRECVTARGGPTHY